MEPRGKEICEKLKYIRKQIAEANGICYSPSTCTSTGFCRGTCPACEQERSFLEQQLRLKQLAGQAVKVVGLVSGLTVLSAQPLNAQTTEQLNDNTVMEWDIYEFPPMGQIPPREETQIDEMAEFVAENRNKLFIILGHTDERGSEKYNRKLSLARAKYIETMLKERIKDTSLLIIPVGASFYEPVIPNATNEVEHEQNRRISLEIYVPVHHKGKVGALIEYAICKKMGIEIPPGIDKVFSRLSQQSYKEDRTKKAYDKLAKKLIKLRADLH